MLKVLLLTIFLNFSLGEKNFKNVYVKIIDEDRAINLKEGRAADVYNLDDQKWYIGGERIRGDSLRSDQYNTFEFDEVRDVYFELKYPKQNDFYITHVSAFVDQSSKLGKAYIVDGGIGKKNIMYTKWKIF